MARESGQPGEGAERFGAGPRPVTVRPPIGVCTGDYSQFPELAGRLGGGVSRDEADASASEPTGDEDAGALRGVVTASRLQEAAASGKGGVARLASDAKLTPLAIDWARANPARVKRVNGAAAGASVASGELAGATAGAWVWWMDGHCPAVQKATSRRRDRWTPFAAASTGSALASVVKDLARAIASGRVAGAVLFVPSAARAVCYANRCAAIRAVVATCGEAVEQGIEELGANVFIVEYPHHGVRSIEAMVDRALETRPTAPAAVARQLEALRRC